MMTIRSATRRRWILPLALTVAAMMASPARSEEVKIGVLLPLTGDAQAYGQAALNGVKLAVEQVNAAGGLLGQPVQLVVGDSQSSPQAAVAAAQKLVSIDNVSGLIGDMLSGSTIPVATSVTSTAGVTQIAVASTSPTITTMGDKYLFRTAPSDALGGVALAQVAWEVGFRKLAVIYVNDDFGRGMSDSFSAAFTKLGGTITGSVAQDPGKASYRGELQKLAAGGAEALVPIVHPTDALLIIKQSLEDGDFSKFYFGDVKGKEIIDGIGAKYLDGSFGVSPQALQDSESYKRFAEAYQQKYGEAPSLPYIDGAYDAAMVLMLAIEKAGSPDRAKINDTVREVANAQGTQVLPDDWAKAKELIAKGEKIDYVGASGSVDFNEHGDVKGTFAKWTIENGEYKTLTVFEPAS
jgi:ABC-type branched-subunit amino acid transport system substrate-binding protein